MEIVDARVIVCSPGRNFVTLKLETDAGLYGVGDATLNGRELAVAAYLRDHVVPLLVGRDPADIEDIWQYLYKGAYWRRGPVTMAAVAAVDMALWDIKGKRLDVPVYDLLGGRSRRGVLVYGHASGADLDETVEAVGKYLAMGYRAVRAQSGLPGMPTTYGVGKGELSYEPADLDAPAEEVWSTEAYLDFVPTLFAALRAAHGWDVKLLHDSHHRLTAQEAAWLGKRLEDHRLFWLEDPVPAELQQGFRLIRAHTTVPIALGEMFNSIYDCEQLLREQLIDYIRMSPVHGGGLTHLRKIAHFAETYRIRTACHGPTDVSPVSVAAALHFDLSVHNFGIQEYMRHPEQTDRVFPHGYTFDDGYLHPGDAPGLGVDVDEDLAGEFPYRRAYLPVNRLVDGTVHDW